MVLGILTVQSALCGVAMKKTVTPEHTDIARFTKPELTLASQSLNGPDPRLVEFVRLLARRAAREWYEQIIEERRPKRS
jgi:hypothetical protein